MSIGESMRRLIGIEEVEEDEITEEEVRKAKEKIVKQAPKRERPMSEPTPAPERRSAPIPERRSASAQVTSSSAASASRGERRFTVTSTNAFKLVLLEPKTFEECPKLVDSLKSRKPVIINLEKLEMEVARKIFDFLSGATYALNGNVQKVANNIFIFAPENVDIAGGIRNTNPGFDFTRETTIPLKDSDPDNPWK